LTDNKTDQELFWEGDFGDDYSDRNIGNDWIASNTAFFSKILDSTQGIRTVIEFGSNIGLNIKALNNLLPQAKFSAIEINKKAVDYLNSLQLVENVYHQSIFDFNPMSNKYDLVLIKGVLIHINPKELSNVYEKLYQSCGRYILIAEYYNPIPVEVRYRGHEEKLYKRDFAGELLDKYDDIKLVDYGFTWRRDPNFPQDDITWFLLEKICTSKE
jgi:spore coat polysaccharide biosynthesis protein SpsF